MGCFILHLFPFFPFVFLSFFFKTKQKRALADYMSGMPWELSIGSTGGGWFIVDFRISVINFLYNLYFSISHKLRIVDSFFVLSVLCKECVVSPIIYHMYGSPCIDVQSPSHHFLCYGMDSRNQCDWVAEEDSIHWLAQVATRLRGASSYSNRNRNEGRGFVTVVHCGACIFPDNNGGPLQQKKEEEKKLLQPLIS